jgi:hypothetical protein
MRAHTPTTYDDDEGVAQLGEANIGKKDSVAGKLFKYEI